MRGRAITSPHQGQDGTTSTRHPALLQKSRQGPHFLLDGHQVLDADRPPLKRPLPLPHWVTLCKTLNLSQSLLICKQGLSPGHPELELRDIQSPNSLLSKGAVISKHKEQISSAHHRHEKARQPVCREAKMRQDHGEKKRRGQDSHSSREQNLLRLS